MSIHEAFELVLNLARENILDEQEAEGDPSLEDSRAAQLEAVNQVEDFIVNHLGDD